MTATRYKEIRTIFDTAYANYQKALRNRAFFKVSNPLLAEDLVQNTFMKTWVYLMKGGKIRRMKAFLYNILNKFIIDEYRRRKTASLDALMTKGFDIKDPESGRMTEKADQEKILLFVENLPKKYRTAIKLRYVEDCSLEEMSKKMKQSKNSVAVQIHRGIYQLKKLYTH